MKTKVGVVGTGQIAQLMHIPYIKKMDKYYLAAACDVSPELVRTVCSDFSIPTAYTDHQEMLRRENLDSVIVCVSDECHEQVCIDASEAGCDILLEKPIALSIGAAGRMVKAAEKASRFLMMAYMKRYDPSYEIGSSLMIDVKDDTTLIRVHDFPGGYRKSSMSEVLRRIIKKSQIPQEKQEESKELRKRLLTEQLGDNIPEEESIWRELLGLGTHDMTILRGTFGDPKRIIAATTVPGIASINPQTKTTGPTIVSLLDYGKAKCTFEIGGPEHPWFDEELAAFATDQTISIRFPYPWIKNMPTIVTVIKDKNGGFEENTITYSYDEAFEMEHIHFLECIEKNTEPRTPGDEGRKDLEFLFEILLQIRRERKVGD